MVVLWLCWTTRRRTAQARARLGHGRFLAVGNGGGVSVGSCATPSPLSPTRTGSLSILLIPSRVTNDVSAGIDREMAISVRHAVLSLHKREQWYEDIRSSVGGSDFNPLAASGIRNCCSAMLARTYARNSRRKYTRPSHAVCFLFRATRTSTRIM